GQPAPFGHAADHHSGGGRRQAWPDAFAMKPHRAIFLGALLGAVGVAAGAIGSHLLTHPLARLPEHRDEFEMAVRYQMYHALGLVLVGLLGVYRESRTLGAASWAFLGGVLLFSGGLYGHVAAVAVPLPVTFLVHLVPFGGASFMAGWLAL